MKDLVANVKAWKEHREIGARLAEDLHANDMHVDTLLAEIASCVSQEKPVTVLHDAAWEGKVCVIVWNGSVRPQVNVHFVDPRISENLVNLRR